LVFANNNNYSSYQTKQSVEEINSCCDYINSLTEGLADETDNDSNKHIFLFEKKVGISRNLAKNSNRIYYNHSADRILLLNAYLDLPPPIIS